jgi:putative membrane protein
MGGMMGASGTWMLLWSLLGLALAVLVVAGGIWAARVLSTRHRDRWPQVNASAPPGTQEARDALRLRYARGEISREDYLQGKVELED